MLFLSVENKNVNGDESRIKYGIAVSRKAQGAENLNVVINFNVGCIPYIVAIGNCITEFFDAIAIALQFWAIFTVVSL